ncbi:MULTISPECIES: helix-turn-helix domain-containing protein [unclassified Lentimonas]|uniref:helix-turn-helix domain-containing protein n=1 Tax=unclassified Lentimonas TaxID=2630993 RepID=UPI001389BCDF|nr:MULTISPECIES: helix-turn-helix domain-containing protein [unclassified Lentimonas]
MHQIRTVDISLIIPAFRFCKANGIATERVLHLSKIPEAMFEVGGRISRHQVYRFYSEIARQDESGEFAAHMDELVDYNGDFIAMGLYSCINLKHAITRMQQQLPLVIDSSHIEICTSRDEPVCLRYKSAHGWDNEERVVQQTIIGFLIALVRIVTSDEWLPKAICIPKKTDSTQSLFKLAQKHEIKAVHYKTDIVGIYIDAPSLFRKLIRPPHKDDKSMPEAHHNLSLGFIDAIKGLVASHLEAGHLLTYHDIADICGLSERTFQRDLKEKGYNYRMLVNEIRHHLACQQLTQTNATVECIAIDLGYSCHNPFVRAFKAIEGVTPSDYRTQIQR